MTPSVSPTSTQSIPIVQCDTLSLPAIIPDNSATGIDNTIDTIVQGNISNLVVDVTIQHEWVGDLRITLEHSESGRQVVLLDRPGVPASPFGCAGADIQVTFDDSAPSAAEDACDLNGPAISGTLRPVGHLADFDGETFSGHWVLSISDNSAGASGMLLGWCLHVTASAAQ